MTDYLGDFAEDATVKHWWNSNDGDGESVNFDDYVIYKEVSFTYESDVKFKMRKVKGG